MSETFRTTWSRLSLAQRYGLVSCVIILLGMLSTGWWIGREIESGATHITATTTSLYISSFIAPHVQELVMEDSLSPENIAALKQQLERTPLGSRVVSIKVWSRTGKIVYSNQSALIGQRFPVKEDLATALQGNVDSSLSDLDEEENITEKDLGVALLETYAPLRDKKTGKVIAAMEFYERANDLVQEISAARSRTWLIVALSSLAMFGVLFAIVRKGNQTITAQQAELTDQLEQVSGLLQRNISLHRRVREASLEATEINEQLLRRMSSDLHDGPAQGIGFALLRFDALSDALAKMPKTISDTTDLDRIRSSLRDALTDIRNLSGGMALPELENLSLSQTIARVARAHEKKTATRVAVELSESLPDNVPMPLKINVYRFLQEALSNAFWHAAGKEQKLIASAVDDGIRIEVSDRGSGIIPPAKTDANGHLGLAGMRRRVEAFGGTFSLDSSPQDGTRVAGIFPISKEDAFHV